LPKVFKRAKEEMIKLNEQALKKGAGF